MSKYTKEEIIKMVEDCILKDRQNTYGKPEDNFGCIAKLWNEYLFRSKDIHDKDLLYKKDVAVMMILLKVARMASSPDHIDNYVDAAGYAAIAGSMCDK